MPFYTVISGQVCFHMAGRAVSLYDSASVPFCRTGLQSGCVRSPDAAMLQGAFRYYIVPMIWFFSRLCRFMYRLLSFLPRTGGFSAGLYAGVAELADAPDLGSGGFPCRFKSCHPHHGYTYCNLNPCGWTAIGVFLFFIKTLKKYQSPIIIERAFFLLNST